MSTKERRVTSLRNAIRRLEGQITILKAESDRLSWLRLVFFAAGTIAALFAYSVGGWPVCLVVLALAIFAFGGMVAIHDRVSRRLERHKIWLGLKKTQLARATLEWEKLAYHTGSQPSADSDHPFETDLDLTGPRSLHRLLDTARTREGSQRLREWLLTTHPDYATILQRQARLTELAPLSLFRDRLALSTELIIGSHGEVNRRKLATTQPGVIDRTELLDNRTLLVWLERNANTQPVWRSLVLMAAIALLTIVLFGLSRFGLVSNYFWLSSLAVYAVIFNLNSESARTLLEDTYTLSDGLSGLSSVLTYLEKYNYRGHPALQELCQPLLDRANRPSRLLKKISRILVMAALKRNFPIWLVLNTLLPLKFWLAHELNVLKGQLAVSLPIWLEIWTELEALNSLANFSYLNPHYTPPQLSATPQPGQPVLVGRGLGHPLIADAKKVTNDFTFNALGEVIIVTGSNMAGKSSFLRTLGVNLVLAQAGGVVDAALLDTPIFRLFTCIKVSDSVTDGFSYFYAEVRRLKALLAALNQPNPQPLFFLIDEIFRGTNNRERLIGSRSYLRSLVGKPSVGVISTHDLELVRLADTSPQIKNFHFREEVQDGLMVFDYRLRSGPSPTTNALKIMRMEGLPVEMAEDELNEPDARLDQIPEAANRPER